MLPPKHAPSAGLRAPYRAVAGTNTSSAFHCKYACEPPLGLATIPRMRKIVLLFAVLFLLPAVVFAAVDVSGKWNARVDLGGQGGTPTFVLKQDGEKLTGKYTGALGDADLTGTVKEKAISFDFEVQGAKVHYEGKVSDDAKSMEGTCDYGGQASGTFKATKAEEH